MLVPKTVARLGHHFGQALFSESFSTRNVCASNHVKSIDGQSAEVYKESGYRTVRSAIYTADKPHDRVHKMAGIHTYVALKTAGGGETETLLSTEHVKDM